MTAREPIAIVATGCVLPDADSAQALFDNVVQKRSAIRPAPAGRMGIRAGSLKSSKAAPQDGMLHDEGAYVTDEVALPQGLLGDSAETLAPLDPLFHWVVRCAHDALTGAGYGPGTAPANTGLILGNLSFPTEQMSRWGAKTVLGPRVTDEGQALLGLPQDLDRFMSGLPAVLAAQALGLDGAAYCLDAACASSLYAIRYACDRLWTGDADLMLAGAVNRADALFIHVGFTALAALSPTARSRPFAEGADGLVPGEGCGVVALMRLKDAERERRPVLGLIRGVGLSNDGRAKNLLAPSSEGQVRALKSAYEMAGIDPRTVSLVECHATGTPLGDQVELDTLHTVFEGAAPGSIATGSLKGNLGHLITAAGVAGLFKVLGALRTKTLPPTLGADKPVAGLRDPTSPFSLVQQPSPWEAGDGPRRAGISAFGFGGNNAHLIVEEYTGPSDQQSLMPAPVPEVDDIVVVALGARVGDAQGPDALDEAQVGPAARAGFDAAGVRFPPHDLAASLTQQILMLAAARDAAAALPEALRQGPRTGAVVGMGCDVDVTTPGLRWRLDALCDRPVDQDLAGPVLTAAGVLGQMPNIAANRLSTQFDLRGPTLTVSAEDLSGIAALDVAVRALRQGELDCALVGAVDCCADERDEAALSSVFGPVRGGDAAVCLAVCTTSTAAAHGLTPLATLDVALHTGARPEQPASWPVRAHAAEGMLALARAIQSRRNTTLSLEGGFGNRATVELTPGDGTMRAPDVAQLWMDHPAHRAFGPLRAALDGAHAMPAAPRLVPVVASRDAAPVALSGPMTAPPALVPLLDEGVRTRPVRTAPAQPAPAPAPAMSAPLAAAPAPRPSRLPDGHAAAVIAAREDLMRSHTAFLQDIGRAQAQFIETQRRLSAAAFGLPDKTTPALVDIAPPAPAPAEHVTAPVETFAPVAAPTPVDAAPAPAPAAIRDTTRVTFRGPDGQAALEALRTEPLYNRHELERLASDKISSVLGPLFERQDNFRRQVRMPEPPLLLCDRVLSADCTLGKLETDKTIITESDVTWDKWYIENGRVPASVLIESGQADLLLISMMGVDFDNKGERVYRLLGCDLTYHAPLPAVGSTLHYDIHIDSFASMGDTRMFFFHSDCRLGPDGPLVLSVRNGQAGFFTDAELDGSGGILWTPADVTTFDGPLDPPKVDLQKHSFSRQDLEALAAGDAVACFGESHKDCAWHVRTPAPPLGDMLLMDRVVEVNPTGGPWGRGYLKAELNLTGDNWFFDGHFKDDPCMPGTIMFEGCLQTLGFYLIANGFSVGKDGFRIEPTLDTTFPLKCRGQATPKSRHMVYEVFIRSVEDGPTPTAFADILVTVDGLKGLHCDNVGVRLVPDSPMSSRPDLLGVTPRTSTEDAVGGVGHPDDGRAVFDQTALLATGIGQPSQAFPGLYDRFDDGTRVPRLPGPPYHFMSRVESLTGPGMGAFDKGNEVVVAYDVPPDAWYFAVNTVPEMPFAVLLEVALQPCGWLSSYTGSVLQVDEPVFYRNLDGNARILRPITAHTGTLWTHARMTNISHSAGMIIQSFDIEVRDQNGPVFVGDTVFGFFPEAALARQVGVGSSDAQRAALTASCDHPRCGTALQGRAGHGGALPGDMLRMIDTVRVLEPEGGSKGLGRIVTEKTVDPAEWFFKAHFYQDPVQPGSLGLEAVLQAIGLLSSEKRGQPELKLAPIVENQPIQWKYRGQVIPQNQTIVVDADIIEWDDEKVMADASLWVDGLRIYHAPRIGLTFR